MQKLSVVSVLCVGMFLVCLSSATMKGQSLLVVNQGNATVSVVDPASQQTVAVIEEKTGNVHGHEITVSPDGKTAYLPIYGSTGVGKPGIDGHEMFFIDVPSRTITSRLDFGHGIRPHLPVIDPVSGLLYVTTELDQTVTVIDPKTRKIVGTVPTGQEQSHMLVLSHDGRLGYTANVGPGTVSVLDLKARKTLAVIPVAGEVQRISISNDDKLLFTSDYTKPQLVVIDTATRKVKQTIELPNLGYGSASTKDGKWLLIAVPQAKQVAVIDLEAMKVVRTIDVPALPQEVLVRPDGKVAYVSCNQSGQVAAIDLGTWAVQKIIPTSPLADGLAWVSR